MVRGGKGAVRNDLFFPLIHAFLHHPLHRRPARVHVVDDLVHAAGGAGGIKKTSHRGAETQSFALIVFHFILALS